MHCVEYSLRNNTYGQNHLELFHLILSTYRDSRLTNSTLEVNTQNIFQN